jgi:hypothetical protein
MGLFNFISGLYYVRLKIQHIFLFFLHILFIYLFSLFSILFLQNTNISLLSFISSHGNDLQRYDKFSSHLTLVTVPKGKPSFDNAFHNWWTDGRTAMGCDYFPFNLFPVDLLNRIHTFL